MSYVFELSSRDNDLYEVDDFLNSNHGEYTGHNHQCRDGQGKFQTYQVEFTDKRFALQFKLRFTCTTVKWDESDDVEIVTVEDMIDRGYVQYRVEVLSSRSWDFQQWCHEQKFAVVDELKIFSKDLEPFTIYCPPEIKGVEALVKLQWT